MSTSQNLKPEVNGPTLSDILAQQGSFSERQIWDFLVQALPLLAALHHQGLIHGDIQPAHWIQPAPAHKLSLVGIEAAQGSTLGVKGSPEYAAPEQLRGQAIAASDLYSLGMTALHLLTGISPFMWLDAIPDSAPWMIGLLEPLSPALQRVLTKLTAADWRDRYQTAEEVLQVIQPAGGTAMPFPSREGSSGREREQWQCVGILSGVMAAVNAVVIHPNEHWLWSGTADGKLQRWNLNNGHLEWEIAAHSKSISTLTLSANGCLLVTGSDDRTLKLWQVNPDQPDWPLIHLGSLEGHTHCVKTVVISPDGNKIASGSWDKTLKLWHIETQQLLKTYRGHRLPLSSLAFHPQKPWLVSGSLDSEILIWDTVAAVEHSVARLTGHHRSVTSLAFSPQGQWLASGSDDCTIQLWQLFESGSSLQAKIFKTLSAHAWSVRNLVFTPEGDRLISGSWDQTIKVWHIPSGQECATLTGHSDSVNAVDLSPSGHLLVSGSQDRTIRIWHRS